MEKWINITWTNNIYAVSNEGRVRSNNCPRKDGRVCKETVLKTWVGNHGYQTVALRVNGKYKRCTVHSLVAEFFLGPKPKGTEVDHIDGDKLNNTANNLQYITRKQNIMKYYQQGYTEEKRLERQIKSSVNGQSVIRQKFGKSVKQYTLDNQYIATYQSLGEASFKTTGSKSQGSAIAKCCNGVYKQYAGYHWRWVEQSVTTSSDERKEKGENPSFEAQDNDDIV